MKGLLIGLGLGTLLGGAAVYIWTVGKRAEELNALEEEKEVNKKSSIGENGKEPIIFKEKGDTKTVDYTNFFSKTRKKEEKKTEKVDETESKKNDIEIIPPEEFDIDGDYDSMSFTYFSDGVLVDDMGEPISETDAAKLIGEGTLEHFGEYEEDSVYVRNDERRTYYEILYRYETYSDYKESKPRRVEMIE